MLLSDPYQVHSLTNFCMSRLKNTESLKSVCLLTLPTKSVGCSFCEYSVDISSEINMNVCKAYVQQCYYQTHIRYTPWRIFACHGSKIQNHSRVCILTLPTKSVHHAHTIPQKFPNSALQSICFKHTIPILKARQMLYSVIRNIGTGIKYPVLEVRL